MFISFKRQVRGLCRNTAGRSCGSLGRRRNQARRMGFVTTNIGVDTYSTHSTSLPSRTKCGPMPLTLSPVRKSSSTSEGADSDYDVLCEGRYVGRIARANSTSRGAWYWGIAFRPHHRSGPHHGHASDRQAALIAFHEIWKQMRLHRS